MKLPVKGLYAITQCENKSPLTIIDEVAAAIRGGAVMIQYRDKNPVDALSLADDLAALCQQHNIPLIINDNIELAVTVAAAGVHLGKDDGDIVQARKRLGPNAIIGLSCYDNLEKAVTAQAEGANYVAFGRFFPSSSKPLASPASIETLQNARSVLSIPIVAIGGIRPENGSQLLTAGADLLAVIGAVFDKQPEQSARAFKPLFDRLYSV